MWSLQRDPNVGRFYLRRIFRIYPLWIVVFLLILLLRVPTSPLFGPNFGFHMPIGKEWWYQILLLFNLRYGPTVVGASWTLPIEVEMYLLLPYLFYFMRNVRAVWPLFVLAGFVILWDYASYPAEYGALPMAIPYFMGGIIAYQMSRRLRAVLPSWTFPLFVGALVAYGYHHGNYRVSWGICLVLGLGLPLFQQMTWTPAVRCSHLIARYSYGVYLGHFIAIAVGSYYLRGFPLAVRALGYAATLLAVPVAFYHLVEHPMIRLGQALAKTPLFGRSERDLNLEPAP